MYYKNHTASEQREYMWLRVTFQVKSMLYGVKNVIQYHLIYVKYTLIMERYCNTTSGTHIVGS